MEHAMSAYYPQLPHGAGLIAISQAYFTAFKNDRMKRYMKMFEIMTEKKSARPSDFVDALMYLQKNAVVDGIKLSDYGITPDDFPRFADNAVNTMGGLFAFDPRPLDRAEIIDIYAKSYK